MTLTLRPTARVIRTTQRPVSYRRFVARALVVLAAVFVAWLVSLPNGAPAERVTSGPPSSAEILSQMNAQP